MSAITINPITQVMQDETKNSPFQFDFTKSEKKKVVKRKSDTKKSKKEPKTKRAKRTVIAKKEKRNTAKKEKALATPSIFRNSVASYCAINLESREMDDLVKVYAAMKGMTQTRARLLGKKKICLGLGKMATDKYMQKMASGETAKALTKEELIDVMSVVLKMPEVELRDQSKAQLATAFIALSFPEEKATDYVLRYLKETKKGAKGKSAVMNAVRWAGGKMRTIAGWTGTLLKHGTSFLWKNKYLLVPVAQAISAAYSDVPTDFLPGGHQTFKIISDVAAGQTGRAAGSFVEILPHMLENLTPKQREAFNRAMLANPNSSESKRQRLAAEEASSWMEGVEDAFTSAAKGAASGAAMGSVVPGIGTMVGGAVGAVGYGALGLLRGYFTGRGKGTRKK